MASSRSVFPLRLREERLRELVRDVASREQISQNEFIEQAVEHEVVARGAMLADDLAHSAEQLRRATQAQHAELVERSLAEFARGELQRDPLRASRIEEHPERSTDALGVVAAFRGDDA